MRDLLWDGAGFDPIKLIKSSFKTKPFFPLPLIDETSIFFSKAIFLAAGEILGSLLIIFLLLSSLFSLCSSFNTRGSSSKTSGSSSKILLFVSSIRFKGSTRVFSQPFSVCLFLICFGSFLSILVENIFFMNFTFCSLTLDFDLCDRSQKSTNVHSFSFFCRNVV